MELQYEIEKQTLKRVDKEKPTENSSEYLFANFNFSKDWEDVKKINVYFSTDNKQWYICENIKEGRCEVPQEVISYPSFSVYLVGYNEDDLKVITTSISRNNFVAQTGFGKVAPTSINDIRSDTLETTRDGNTLYIEIPDGYVTDEELQNKLDEALETKLDKLQANTPEYNFAQGVYANDGSNNFLKSYTSLVHPNSLVERTNDGAIKFNTTNSNDNEQGVNVGFLKDSLQNVIEIAEGKTNTYTLAAQPYPDCVNELFATDGPVSLNGTDKLYTWQGTITVSDLKTGDIILIVQTNYPDRWVGLSPATGVYVFEVLEARKIDLTDINNEINDLKSNKLDKQRNLNYGIYAYQVTSGDQLLAYKWNAVKNTIVMRNEKAVVESKTDETNNDSTVNIEYFNSKQIKYIDLETATTGTLTDEQFALLQENHKNYIKTHFYDYYADYYYFNTHNDGTIYYFNAIIGNAEKIELHFIRINPNTKAYTYLSKTSYVASKVDDLIEKNLVIDTSVKPTILSSEDYNTIVDNLNSIVIHDGQIKYRFVKETDASYQFSASYIDSHELMHVYRISIDKTTHEVLTLFENVPTKRYVDQEYTKLKLKKKNYISYISKALLGDSSLIGFSEPVTLLLSIKAHRYHRKFKGDEIFGPHIVIKQNATKFTLQELIGVLFPDLYIYKDFTPPPYSTRATFISFLKKYIDSNTTDFLGFEECYANFYSIYSTTAVPLNGIPAGTPLEQYLNNNSELYSVGMGPHSSSRFDRGYDMFKPIASSGKAAATCWFSIYLKPVTNYQQTLIETGNENNPYFKQTKYIAGTYGVKINFMILSSIQGVDPEGSGGGYQFLLYNISKVKLK